MSLDICRKGKIGNICVKGHGMLEMSTYAVAESSAGKTSLTACGFYQSSNQYQTYS